MVSLWRKRYSPYALAAICMNIPSVLALYNLSKVLPKTSSFCFQSHPYQYSHRLCCHELGGTDTVVGPQIQERSCYGNNCLAAGHLLAWVHANNPIDFVSQADFLAHRGYYGQGSCCYNRVGCSLPSYTVYLLT